jgi:hypothetical protein
MVRHVLRAGINYVWAVHNGLLLCCCCCVLRENLKCPLTILLLCHVSINYIPKSDIFYFSINECTLEHTLCFLIIRKLLFIRKKKNLYENQKAE